MATTGAKLARLGETVSELPYDDYTWNTPTNIYADDGANATVVTNSFDTGTTTYVLKASNFDLAAVPDGAAITGVIVKINCYYVDAAVNLTLCQLLGQDHAKVGTNHASSPVALSTGTGTVLTEGASGDTWGNALTAAWVKDADFGVALGFTSAGTNSEVYVDYVTLEVEYQAVNGIDTTIKVGCTIALFVAPYLMSSVVLRENAGINPATIIRVAESATISPQVVDTSVNINVSELTIGVAEEDPVIHPDPLQIYGIDTPIKVLSTTSIQTDSIHATVIEGIKVSEQFSSWLDLFNSNRIDLTISVADSATIQADNRLLNVSDTPIVPSDTIEIFRPELNVFTVEIGVQNPINITVADTGEIDVITLVGPDIILDKLNEPVTIAEETTIWREFIPLDIAEGIGVSDTQVSFLPELNLPEIELTISVADSGEIQPTELHLDVSQPIGVIESSVLFLPELVLPVAEAIGVSEAGEIAPTELHLDITQPVTVADSGAISVQSEGEINVSGTDPLVLRENSGINPATIIRVGESFFIEVGAPGAFGLNAIEDTITLAETASKWTAELNLNFVESTITVAEAFTIPGGAVSISVSEGIGISEYAAPVVKYCIYVRDEATIFRPELNVVVSEAIGVNETEAIAPTELHLSVIEGIGVAESIENAYWTVWLLDAATITEQAYVEVHDATDKSVNAIEDTVTVAETFQTFVLEFLLRTAEGIKVSESAAIAPTELHLDVADTAITVADSGAIQPTELHVAPANEGVSVAESTEIFRTTLNTPEIELTVTVAESAVVNVAAVHISGADAIAIAESITAFWNTKNVPEGEGIGVGELGWIHVEGTVYTPINMNFPLVDNITVAEEATLLRPTLFITATEQTIGIHETETTWMAERNVQATQGIAVSESATIEKQAFGRFHVIWVEPHNRIVDVKPRHRKNWVDTQTREA